MPCCLGCGQGFGSRLTANHDKHRRRAVVTGGTRGIGRAVVQRLLTDGFEILVVGQGEPGREPDGTTYHQADLGDREQTESLASAIAQWAPGVLVNNAGINQVGEVQTYPPDVFRRIQTINVEAPFLLCQAVVSRMRARAWGRIVNVSSVWGKITRAGRAAYSASKFGLDGMSVALAAEVARDGVLVNCVAPGFIDTELTRRVLGESGILELTAQVPAGRLGQPEEVAELIAWLVSEQNTYVTGQNIAIDGGFTRV